MIKPQIMSHQIINIAIPIRLRFAVRPGTWEEWEGSDDLSYGWEFIPSSNGDSVESEPEDVGHASLMPVVEPAVPDPWTVRNEFIELAHDDRDGLRNFLHKTGAFCWIEYRPISESEFWEFQAAIRQQMLRPTVSQNRTQLATKFELSIHNRIQVHVMKMNVGLDDGTLLGEVEALNTFDAILSTIFIDRLRNLRFKVCARPDCASIYELTSQHKRKYCSYDCAHLMSVRQSRKVLKRKMEKSKKKR